MPDSTPVHPVRRVANLLESALALLTDGNCAMSLQFCRTGLYLAGEVPWDECDDACGTTTKNGMLWAKLGPINPTIGGSDALSPRCKSYDWTGEIGVVRCITKGNPIPAMVDITADADQQITDADEIFTALTCCLPPNSPLEDVTLNSWNPLGPDGGCAGGAWTLRGRLDVCC